MYGSRLTKTKQNFIKSKLPYINNFDYEGPSVISAMRDLTVGVFERVEIAYKLDLYLRIKYT